VFLRSPGRELAMAAMALLSLRTTPPALRRENGFSWHPIQEVAILFAGIFATMIPALVILEARGDEFGIVEPWQFFWLTGLLSSFLDNAPTYLTFLTMAQGLGLPAQVVGVPDALLKAISCGAVFMGANSYIGNGPNFMVKVIAETARIPMPHFFGYMGYSMVVLFPIYVLLTFLFFR
jgi:Na+/H+ antiporter NhaD/arsenite permease-like protein